MTEHNDLTGEAILKYIRKQSEKNRSAPLECFRDFLRDIWMDNTEEEALEQWRAKVKEAPWYADDALFCLDWVIANPPDNLVEMIKQDGWIVLRHQRNSERNEREYDRHEYVQWLTDMTARFRRIYDDPKS